MNESSSRSGGSNAPIIGVTTYGRTSENKFPLPADYVDAVRRAGAVPVLLPPGETAIDRLLERIDGLILAGGGDVDPARYGGSGHPAIYMVDAERDRLEIDLVRRSISRGTPLLGICRGCQVLNVALGGTLIQHVPDQYGTRVPHILPPREPVPHDVEVAADSRLAGVLGSAKGKPASWHHQALDQVAADLRVVAHAPDGVIEAVERPGHSWLVGVQWHPELTAAEDPVQQRLFAALVDAARRENTKDEY